MCEVLQHSVSLHLRIRRSKALLDKKTSIHPMLIENSYFFYQHLSTCTQKNTSHFDWQTAINTFLPIIQFQKAPFNLIRFEK